MRRPRKTVNQMNVVPYIDVMLVLLVIFMVAAPLITPGEIELPTVGNRPAVPSAPLYVRVYRNGDVAFRDQQSGQREQRMKLDDVIERVRTKQSSGSNQAVVIEADRNVLYDRVVAVLDALQRSGATKVGLVVQPPQR